MVLPVPGTPHDSGFWDVEVARLTYRFRGILFRALGELEKTPKPWPDNIRKSRNALLKVHTGLKEKWDAFPQEIRQQAVRSIATED